MIAIKYISHRPVYADGACGSGLTFKKGQTLLVDEEFANKMLRHPSVYELGDPEGVESASKPEVSRNSAQESEEDADQSSRDAIASMGKKALITYAKTHFSLDLDKQMSVGDMRTKVTGLYDQFGVD